MVKVTLTGYVRCNHRRHPPGASLEVAEEVAQHIVKAGAGLVVGKVEELNPGVLNEISYKALRKLAADRGIEGYAKMKKDALIQALSESEG